jgi:hypothetical protein
VSSAVLQPVDRDFLTKAKSVVRSLPHIADSPAGLEALRASPRSWRQILQPHAGLL